MCMFWILLTTLESFSDRILSFTVQTTYLGWNTTFPAVTLCELFNSEKVWDSNSDLNDGNMNNFNDFIGDIAFFYGTCFTCEHCITDANCPKNFTEIASNIRSKCDNFFDQCKWNNELIDCCSNFLPLETEFGICFSINSLHTVKLPKSLPPLISNDKIGLGWLYIKAKEDYQAFVHPQEDVPYGNVESDMKLTVLESNRASMAFTIVEVTNDPEVDAIPIDTRLCRFPYEKPENLHAYSIYSYSGCIAQCHIDAQIEKCNCTHHLMPSYYKDSYCDIKGLQCLTEYYTILASLKVPGTDALGLECQCLPTCTEPEYSVVDIQLLPVNEDDDVNVAEFKLCSLPSLRYNRQVVRTSLDLVVAVGNAIGLFFGASILSIVEIFYYLMLRKWN